MTFSQTRTRDSYPIYRAIQDSGSAITEERLIQLARILDFGGLSFGTSPDNLVAMTVPSPSDDTISNRVRHAVNVAVWDGYLLRSERDSRFLYPTRKVNIPGYSITINQVVEE